MLLHAYKKKGKKREIGTGGKAKQNRGENDGKQSASGSYIKHNRVRIPPLVYMGRVLHPVDGRCRYLLTEQHLDELVRHVHAGAHSLAGPHVPILGPARGWHPLDPLAKRRRPRPRSLVCSRLAPAQHAEQVLQRRVAGGHKALYGRVGRVAEVPVAYAAGNEEDVEGRCVGEGVRRHDGYGLTRVYGAREIGAGRSGEETRWPD